MSDMVNLCAKIPKELHSMIKSNQVDSGMTLNDFMEYFIMNYYEMETKIEKGVTNMSKQRTLAIQIDEELFQKIDEYIKRKGLKKREFLLNLIETALAEETTDESKENLDNEEETIDESEENFDNEEDTTDESEENLDNEEETTDESEENHDDEVETTEEYEETQHDNNTLGELFRNY